MATKDRKWVRGHQYILMEGERVGRIKEVTSLNRVIPALIKFEQNVINSCKPKGNSDKDHLKNRFLCSKFLT
jgi:hypothetical protein